MAPRHSALVPAEDGFTVIGASLVVRGRLEGDESVRIDGKVEGSLAVTENVHISVGARVIANVSAKAVVVEGVVIGDIEATSSIVVRSSARIVGNLAAPRIAVADGAAVRGNVDMGDYVPPDDRALRAAHGSGALAAGASGALRPRASATPAPASRPAAPQKAPLRSATPTASRAPAPSQVRAAAPAQSRSVESSGRSSASASRRSSPPELEASIERYDTHPSGHVSVNAEEEPDDDGYELEDGEASDDDYEGDDELAEDGDGADEQSGAKVPQARMPARGKRRIQTRG